MAVCRWTGRCHDRAQVEVPLVSDYSSYGILADAQHHTEPVRAGILLNVDVSSTHSCAIRAASLGGTSLRAHLMRSNA